VFRFGFFFARAAEGQFASGGGGSMGSPAPVLWIFSSQNTSASCTRKSPAFDAP